MSEKEHKELHNVLASNRMEGYFVNEQTESDCIRLLSGELSFADLVKEIMARPARVTWHFSLLHSTEEKKLCK